MCLWCGCVYIFTFRWHTYTLNDIWNVSVDIPWYYICLNYDLEQRPINYNQQYTSVLIFYKFALFKMFCEYSACCCHYCSFAKSCLTPSDPMDCDTPGFPVPHHNPEFAQVHVHWISDAIQPSPSLSSSSPSVHIVIFMCYTFFLILKLLEVYKFKFIYYMVIISLTYIVVKKMFDILYHNLLLGILVQSLGNPIRPCQKLVCW